jgi:uncharacterized repeat protein (TIGR04138 family)
MQSNASLEEILKRDPRYAADAYRFLMEALAATVHQIGERRHVSGRELLFGLRDLAVDHWGLMARHVLNTWGIRRTEDVGEIVFNLVEAGLLSKTDEDRRDDFQGVFDFGKTFDEAGAPQLDEYGHVRRKLPGVRLDGSVTWIPYFDETGFN